MLEDGLGVLLGDLLPVAPRVLDLLDLLDRLELDEQDDRVDLVVVQPLHGLKVDVEDAVLVLEKKGLGIVAGVVVVDTAS